MSGRSDGLTAEKKGRDLVMTKKSIRMTLGTLAALLLLSVGGVAASAESCGYWEQRVDDTGRAIEVFVYTEPITITHNEGDECLDDDVPIPEQTADAERVETAVQNPVRLAQAQKSDSPQGEDGLLGLAIGGAVFLVLLAAALYKAI